MGTASPGGTYAVYGPLWGALVARATGEHLAYRATQGANQNILLLDRGAIDLGMTTLGVAREAWMGAGNWTHGVKLRGMRALFPMYDTPFQGFALARSGLSRMAQLQGRRVGVGPEGGTGGTLLGAMLAATGVRPAQLLYGSLSDQADQLLAGQLDACVITAGPPVPAFQAAAGRAPLMLFGFAPEEAARLCARMPDLAPSVVARGSYRGQARDVTTVGMFNFALCRHDLPEDLAYLAVRAVLRNPAGLAAAGPLAAGTVARNAVLDRFLPFHAGAARYYREAGIEISGELTAPAGA